MPLNRGRGTDQVPAHRLFRKTLGALDLIPPKYRRQLKTVVYTEEVQPDYSTPSAQLPSGRQYFDLRQKRESTLATLTTMEETILQGAGLVSYKRTKDNQLATCTEQLVPENSAPPPLDALTIDMTQDALGDGFSTLSVCTVPNVFPEEVFRESRPVVTPEVFRALLQEQGHDRTDPGQAVDPGILPPGYVEISDTQIEEYRHRTTMRFLPLLNLPIPVIDSRTNKAKQVETVTRILELDTTIPALPDAYTDVSFTTLGDGTAVEEHDTIPDVFTEYIFGQSRPVVTPEVFRARLQENRFEVTQPGPAQDPGTLPPGYIDITDTQVNLFTHRTSSRHLPIQSLPILVMDSRTNRYKQVESVWKTLELDNTTPRLPDAYYDVSFTTLGDGTAVEEWDFITEEPFAETVYRESRPIVTPEVFRALLQEQGFDQTLRGDASDPGTMPHGYIEQSDTQLTKFTHRTTSRFLPLPTGSFSIVVTGSRTNRYKQVETIDRILEPATATPILPTDQRDVSFTKLGDGTAVEERNYTTDGLFPERIYRQSRPVVTPEVFRAVLQEKSFDETIPGNASDPGQLDRGVFEKSDTELTRFTHRTTSHSIPLPTGDNWYVLVTGSRTNRYKQVESIQRILEPDTATPLLPTDQRNVTFTKLGDGTAVEEREFTTDGVFPEIVYRQSRPIVTPEVFRALLQERGYDVTLPGNASDPGALTRGVIEQSDTQLSLYTHRTTSRSLPIPPPNPPWRVVVHGSRTNRFKQLEHVDRILEPDNTVAADATGLMDVAFTKLGDGTAVEEQTYTDALFHEQSATTEIADLVPEIFKAILPIQVQEYTDIPSTPVPYPITQGYPPLATGDLERTETMINEFVRRVRTRGRSGVVIPQGGLQKIASRELGAERFGGQFLQTVATLNNADMEPDFGNSVVSSQVRDLGNGLWVKQTQEWDTTVTPAITAWPLLVSTNFDPEIQAWAITQTQVFGNDYAGLSTQYAYSVENVEQIDQWHKRSTIITRLPAATSLATAIISYEYRPFQFPGTLDYVRLITYDHHEGYRRASAQLCRHKIYTWWLYTGDPRTPPSVGDPNQGGTYDVNVNEIIMDTVNVPIYRTGDATGAQTYPNVLHDAFTNTLGAYYPATTPSLTQYLLGRQTGTSHIRAASMVYQGTNAQIGATFGLGEGTQIRVLSIQGQGGGILTWQQISQGAGPIPALPVAGAYGSQWWLTDATIPVYDGNGWVGTERAVSATVKPTNIPGLWKVQLAGVVMR